ncbi:hypothetical protein E05_43700 [Plautia stali symbiont]|nr:hypothetical protein E05_43700 [Plautia stali symbiont]
MRGANRHRQRIDAGALHKIFRLRRFGVNHLAHATFHRGAGIADGAEFAFQRYTHCVRQLHHLFGQRYILFVRQQRAVNHYRGKAALNRAQHLRN